MSDPGRQAKGSAESGTASWRWAADSSRHPPCGGRSEDGLTAAWSRSRTWPKDFLLPLRASPLPLHSKRYRKGCAVAPSSTFVASSGDGYELQMGRWSRRLAEPFLDFCGCRDGELVLDAGCGTGALTTAILQRTRTAHISGVDFSDAYVEHARRTILNPRTQFSVGDICALAQESSSFDRVLSLLVLHFVPEPGKAIAELRRVARPGATVGATVWDSRGGFVANRMFFDAAAALFPSGNAGRARNYTRPMTRPGELAKAWRAGGLTDVHDTMLTIRMEFGSFDDYWMPYEGKDGPGAQFLATLRSEERERLRNVVRAAYLDGDPDGPRSYAATAWAVKGVVPS